MDTLEDMEANTFKTFFPGPALAEDRGGGG